jgi:hypothetical protein
MAQKIQVLFIDDLDGGEAEGTVRFGLDGADYEIDLSAKNAAALRKALARRVIQGTGTLCEVYPVRRRGTIKDGPFTKGLSYHT